MYVYNAKIIDVYDGDTFTFIVDLGFSIQVKEKLRLWGVDTPELRGETRTVGLEVRDYVRDLIKDQNVTIEVYKRGKYGRYVARVYFFDDKQLEGHDLSEHLLAKGMATRLTYD